MRGHKICLVTHLFPRSKKDYKGVFVRDLAAELILRGHEVHVVTPMRPGARKEEIRNGIFVHRFAYWGWRAGKQLGELKGTSILLLGSMIILGVMRCVATVLRYNTALIHAYWVVPGGLVGAISGFLTRRPVIATAAGSDLNIAPQNRIARLLIKLTLKMINQLVAVSTSMRQIAIDL